MTGEQFKLIAFDIDGTLTSGLSWERFHTLVGITPEENRKLIDAYYAKEISFDQWIGFISEKYKSSGRTRKELEEIASQIPFFPGARETVEKIKGQYPVCIVSSGIDMYVSAVAKELGIDVWGANCWFEFDQQDRVIAVKNKTPEDQAKVLYLQELCQTRKILPEEIVMVGDNHNDIPAFTFTRHGILVGKGREQFIHAAWKHVENIQEIIPILLP